MSKTYSPSQTMKFQTCPREWWHSRKQGIRSNLITRGDLSAAVGHHVGEAIEAIESGQKPNENRFHEEITKLRKIAPVEKGDVVKFAKLAEKGVKAYIMSDLRPFEPLEVMDTQVNVGEGHDCFIDMLIEHKYNQDLYVWDTKCKLTCDSKNVSSLLGKYENDWQMLHYGYHTWKKYGRVPKGYMIGMVGLQPTTKLYGGTSLIYPYTASKLLEWYDSAKFWWQAMEQCEQAQWAPMANTHHRGWGKCDMFNLCFNYNGNIDIARKNEYIQIQR